jgi:TolB protein
MESVLMFFLLAFAGQSGSSSMVFTSSGDVGTVGTVGNLAFDPQTNTYRITASGANIWDTDDSFYYARKQVRGDVTLTAVVSWDTPGGNAHKKAGLMLRAGTAPDDPHASVMVHGDGLISLQYRRKKGGPTLEVRAPLTAKSAVVRLARHGDVVSLEAAPAGAEPQPAGALTVELPGQLEAGLAVCSHDNSDRQTAVFNRAAIEEAVPVPAKARVVESTLETVDIQSGERRIVYRVLQHLEAPNWTGDGKLLYFNSLGKMYRIPAAGGTPEIVPTGEVQVNNDHGLSPDGRILAISGHVAKGGDSQIFVEPAEGGTPRLVTPKSPSYWHGWSPDGKVLAYCANRGGEYDVYTIPVEGGEETRLTSARGLDDGPDYSPDGKFIYFNSERTGLMRIWRMKPDGSEQEMFSRGPDSADWFAHPSPDGKWVVYLAYDPAVKGHPANKDVTLKIVPAAGGEPRTLATLFGGQGTINVPSWSPDSRRVAFVSYRLIAPPAR